MKKPLIWAHRGASGYAPENTLPAFELAAEMGADGVELDIQMTKDGEIVVCHDERIDRTGSAKGWLKDYTLAELEQLDFSGGNLAYEGIRIPTMTEVFDLLKDMDLTVDIELKTGIVFYEGLEERILALTKEKGFEDRVIYSSFNHYTLRKIRSLDAEAKTGVLYMDGPLDIVPYAKKLEANALHPALYNLQYPGFMEQCRQNRLDVNVWTVNETEYLKLCADFGVHAVITNYPDKAKRVLASDEG